MTTEQYVYLYAALGGLGCGYVIFLGLLYLLPRKLRSENQMQKRAIFNDAKEKGEMLKAEEFGRTTKVLENLAEDMEADITDRMSDLEATEKELDSQTEQLQSEEQRLETLGKDNEYHLSRAQKAAARFEQSKASLVELQSELCRRLETVSGQSAENLRINLKQSIIDDRQLDSTRYLKIVAEQLNISANRLATRILDSSHARYAPRFIWPKGVNHVEVKERKVADLLALEETKLLPELRELTEHVTINFVAEDGKQPVVRLAGGYGIYKEAAKLTLEEILHKGPNVWGKCRDVYERHRTNLEAVALRMGRQAQRDLHLKSVAPEILKMVGALNWRTSYRQNQYYHSVEVAKLAGIIAFELGVDPEAAKRSGLLHDIGKGIDYRIDGSHAVISGDYADRFGETKIICDTVMSHHSDLIVETPLAYVLRSADTLSGARPGARVNLEEGYQDRLSSITDVVKAFPGVVKVEIMNGAREVHVEVNHKRVQEQDLASLSSAIARQIEENVAYPGQIKIMVTRRFEAVSVA